MKALETFTGRRLTEEVKRDINRPCNALNVESNAHDFYDRLTWGIEARQVDDEVNNFFLTIMI
jgi:hypothetical protein